jgi:hypothetical protein
MSISPGDLWPEDIAVNEVLAPVTILKHQASLLGERTKNLVEGSVTQRKRQFSDDTGFTYDFYLVAPALDFYRYRLFSISHGVDFYPLSIQDSGVFDPDGRESKLKVNDEDEFIHALAKIFSSEKTKGIISSLIAQSRA